MRWIKYSHSTFWKYYDRLSCHNPKIIFDDRRQGPILMNQQPILSPLSYFSHLFRINTYSYVILQKIAVINRVCSVNCVPSSNWICEDKHQLYLTWKNYILNFFPHFMLTEGLLFIFSIRSWSLLGKKGYCCKGYTKTAMPWYPRYTNVHQLYQLQLVWR